MKVPFKNREGSGKETRIRIKSMSLNSQAKNKKANSYK